jgi:adenylate cyclase
VNAKRILSGTGARTFILGVAVVAAIFATNSRHPDFISFAELRAGDLRMRAGPGFEPTGKVAVVAIDDESIARLGRWPWSRSLIARLVMALSDYKVSVIGMDLLFTEPDDIDRDHQALAALLGAAGIADPVLDTFLGPRNDKELARAIEYQGTTYLAYPFESHRFGSGATTQVRQTFARTIVDPPPVTFDLVMRPPGKLPALINAGGYLPAMAMIARSARGSAFVDVDADMDGVVRAIPTVIHFDDRFCAPLFMAVVSAYRGGAPLVLRLTRSAVGGVAVGDTRVPVDEMGRMLIDFRGRAGTIRVFSAASVIAHSAPAADLLGRIALVGVSAVGIGDRVVTPTGADIPGVEVQAAAVDNLLAGRFLRRSEVTEGETRLFAILLGLAIAIAVSTMGGMRSAAGAVAMGAGYLIYAQYRLHADGVLLGVVLPMMTLGATYGVLAGYRYVTEGLEKRRLRRAFVHYLAPTLVDRLADDPAELRLGGEERMISVMFADLTGFTAASTEMDPEKLTAKVNRYFDFIVKPIDATGGYVERFLGDAALAFWGAPLSDPDHAIHAIQAAFEVIDGVRRAREEDEARGEAGFTIKVGINSGTAVVGNIGSKDRYSYTAMGEDVNLAARLESVPPLYGCSIVVGENTAKLAAGAFLMRELDWILVKGASQPLTVYQPLAPLASVTEMHREMAARFAVALSHYRAMRFAEACAVWDELAARFEPAPSPSSVMAERARRFISEPPPMPWNAVLVLTSK